MKNLRPLHTANLSRSPFPAILIGMSLLASMACTKINETRPDLPVDSSRASFPNLELSVAGLDSTIINLAPIVPTNEPFTLAISAFTFGSITLIDNNKFLYKSFTNKWRKDTAHYDVCRKNVCRRGFIEIVNRSPVLEPDTVDSTIVVDTSFIMLAPTGSVYINYVGFKEIAVVPSNLVAKIKSYQHNYFKAIITNSDSLKITYTAAGGNGSTIPLIGFDDLYYNLKGSDGKMYKGKVELILGDTNAAQARPDSFVVSGNNITFNQTQITTNDEPQFSFDIYKIRLQIQSYGDEIQINTPNGTLSEALVNGEQVFTYTKTNTTATSDVIPYYLLAASNNRLTRAWIKLKFN